MAAQDRAGFRRALEAALAVDVDASPPDRLARIEKVLRLLAKAPKRS